MRIEPAGPAAPRPGIDRLLTPLPVQAMGWILLIASVYPRLWDKDGGRLFKLDAWVYYHAVAQWFDGGSLYDWYANPAEHLWPFTYPPFAAWTLTPLTWGGDRTAQVLLTAATPVCAAMSAWATARALGVGQRRALAAAPWLGLAGGILLEPIYKTMEYGQVNAILMLLVAVDLLVVPARSRWRGVGTGLAAAFKLTPAIGVVLLLARREWRAAATMAGTAIGATALCWLVRPEESSRFFFSAMLDPSRAGFADYAGNQNLKGAVARWLPEQLWIPVWTAAVVVVALGAWLLLRRLETLRGPTSAQAAPSTPSEFSGSSARTTPTPATGAPQEGLILALQVTTAMVLGLLVSPITWSHHWVWCLPALMTLTAAARRWRSPALAATAVTGLAVFGLAMQWWFPGQNHVEQEWPLWATVVGSSYTWWALAAGVVLWTAAGDSTARSRARALSPAACPREPAAP